MVGEEVPLTGNVTAGVVRVGDTVRRPAGVWAEAVDALLEHLRAVGFEGAPRALGRDEQGRQVLEYVPGELGDDAGTYSEAELASIGRMVAQLHAATATFVAPPGAVWGTVIEPDSTELVVHHDVAPWNLVRSARGWVLIDWDGAGPGSRLWELAYAAQSLAGMHDGREVAESARRLRAFSDGYGIDEPDRLRLPQMLGRRARAMHEFLREQATLGREPWQRIWHENGAYWLATARYLEVNAEVWRAALS